MPMTATEKIIALHAKKDFVIPGEIHEVDIDYCMLNDVTTVITKDIFYNQFKFKKVFDTNKIKFVFDHRVPSDSIDTSYQHKITREFASDLGIYIHEHDGICHQIMIENYIKPGQLVVAADSHTCSYGALGVVSMGMGSTDIAAIMGTGKTWLKVPSTIKIIINGKANQNVYPKDIILYIIKILSSSGASYKAVEFEGTYIDSLNLSERFTLCNMVIEAGGKSSFIKPSTEILQSYNSQNIDLDVLTSDKYANFESIIEIDVSKITRQIACPHFVDNVKNIDEIPETIINQAFLGACTNGRIDDLEIAYNLLKDKKVHQGVRFIITPASVKVYKEAIKRGYIDTFLDSGAIVTHPSCSVCWGSSIGSLAENEVMISTANRNFKGRAGSSKSQIYLASPHTVVESAISGKII